MSVAYIFLGTSEYLVHLLKPPGLILALPLSPQSYDRSGCGIAMVRQIDVQRSWGTWNVDSENAGVFVIRINIPSDGLIDADKRRAILEGSPDAEVLTRSGATEGPVTALTLFELPLLIVTAVVGEARNGPSVSAREIKDGAGFAVVDFIGVS